MGDFSGLNTALTGLLAHRRAIEAIGSNISNVNTEGYSRRQVNLTSLGSKIPGGLYSKTNFGVNGVDIESVVAYPRRVPRDPSPYRARQPGECVALGADPGPDRVLVPGALRYRHRRPALGVLGRVGRRCERSVEHPRPNRRARAGRRLGHDVPQGVLRSRRHPQRCGQSNRREGRRGELHDQPDRRAERQDPGRDGRQRGSQRSAGPARSADRSSDDDDRGLGASRRGQPGDRHARRHGHRPWRQGRADHDHSGRHPAQPLQHPSVAERAAHLDLAGASPSHRRAARSARSSRGPTA